MNNVQKSFKQKAKHGLRAFASGGLLDSFNTRQQGWDASVNNGGGIGVLQNSAVDDWNAGFDARRAAEAEAPQVRRTIMPAAQPIVPDAAPQSLRGFAGGGTVDPVEQMLANMKNKYGVGNQSQPAPAPQPVQAPAPAPAPQPARPVQQAPTIQGAVQAIRSRQEMLRNFANGGEIEPFVDGAGFIHGTPGVDKVPAQVAQTGENILVGDGERIVNQKQNKALEALAQKTTGQPLDDYLEGATGQPVGPKLKKGIRAAENGFNLDEVNARAAQARAINPTAPAATAPMMSPLEIPASQPAARPGIGGIVDRAKTAASGAVNSIRSAVTPSPAPSTAEQLGKIVGQQAGAVRNAPKVLGTNGGGRLAGVDFALRSGQHWDATAGWDDTAKGGIGPMDKGQIVARDAIGTAGDIIGGAAGVGLGGLARAVGPVSGAAGKAIGGLAGAVTGGNLTEQGMGYLRRAANATNAALGGDPNYWKDSDQLITQQNAYLQSQPGYEESSIQKGSKKVSDALDKTVGAALEKAGLITREGRDTPRAQSAEEQRIRKANEDVLGGKQVAADQAAIDTLKAKSTNNPSVRSLRAAGVTGDVGGDTFEWQKDAVGRSSPTTAKTGIRTIDTANGKVYAGRDGNGRLNITSGLDQTAAESEAARSKEAARINADLKRQTETFDKLALERDMKSNNPADRASAAQRMGLRQLDAQIAQANQQNETTRRGQDLVLQGHQLDNQAKLATLTNQRRTARAENILKQLDNEFGPAMLKDDVPNARRQKFESSLRDTLGEVGLDIGDMTPKDMQEFKKAFEMAERIKPSAARQFYMDWIQGRPFVRDFNPHRQVSRAKGDAGKTDATGLYQTANGWDAYAPSAVDSSFLTGAQDINARRYLDK